MNTKKCSKCGWVYPAAWPGRSCKFCHAKLIGGICTFCGEWSDNIQHGLCKECKSAMHKVWADDQRNSAEITYKNWLAKIAAIPKPHKTLTEAEWHEACKHFGGCAYCGSLQIDSRSMFIQFKHGGRYCAWNIVPACERCETSRKATDNPFARSNVKLYRGQANSARKYNLSSEKIDRIVEYLSTKIPGGVT